MFTKKFSSSTNREIIEATPENYDQLAAFLNQKILVHRHLDWFATLDWLGYQPYLIERADDRIQAVLCAAPENQSTAWIRTFGVRKPLAVETHWQRLLTRATQKLRDLRVVRLGALALHSWFQTLLVDSGFENRQNIVVLEWQGKFPEKNIRSPKIEIRSMRIDDLSEIKRIDRLAFPPMWQNSLDGLTKAYNQPGVSTVAIKDGKIVGYQISTSMTIYGHLARLAVDPDCQRQGIAFALVNDLLRQFERLGFWRITVNTQSNNQPSLNLYQIFGFTRTGEEIPVYEMDL